MNIQEIINDADVMNHKEWQKISIILQDHHALFYKIWEMGKPVFSKSIPTACVTFDQQGEFVYFIFNPEFWNSLDDYNKIFVICHEALHIIFEHGLRFKDSKNREQANVAMDVVINHTLLRQFGFDRSKIKDADELCWVDTVFGKNYKINGIVLSDSETAEKYLNLLQNRKLNNKKAKSQNAQSDHANGSSENGKDQEGDQDSQNNQGDNSNKKSNFPRTVDQHVFNNPDAQNGNHQAHDKLVQNIAASMSDEDKKSIKNTMGKHANMGFGSSNPFAPAGLGHGGMNHHVIDQNIKVKKKWESIVKKWTTTRMSEVSKEVEQWARKHRRFSMVGENLFLPTEMDIDTIGPDKKKLEIWFFLDTSGSCWHLKDRFFAIAKSLPKKFFKCNLFCFDTKITPTDLVTRAMYGGGGTCFAQIERYIQTELQNRKLNNKKAKYPDAVWVMTDGEGTLVNPQHPERWFWFLQPHGKPLKYFTPQFIPEKSLIYNLSDFV